jgi:hypothetical protein
MPLAARVPRAPQLQSHQSSHALWASLAPMYPLTGFSTYRTIRVQVPGKAGKLLVLSGLSDHPVFLVVVGGLAARWSQR